MDIRNAILQSKLGRNVALAGTAVAVIGAGIVLPTGPAAQAATCSLGPIAKASSYVQRCGLSQIAYTYQKTVVKPRQKCYYFLATAWNPCSTPTQYNTYACKAI
ncbi:hypothetical protein [Curtobacterium sp. MCJR17_020]|uniref:hypothetical protein n=1 Tax=Curtobacterium sp. MCJR17_020 TaxID=2175619 RepID=UPI0011B6FDCD|nr:hypothetical protein [Curtobacterium sp. MCJR17_020]WIE72561.1 hypothetical protein DEJ14_002000 [Curtobacterium sp. MCJR17_020]